MKDDVGLVGLVDWVCLRFGCASDADVTFFVDCTDVIWVNLGIVDTPGECVSDKAALIGVLTSPFLGPFLAVFMSFLCMPTMLTKLEVSLFDDCFILSAT